MTTYHRPTNRSPRGILSRTPLPLAFTLIMLLGSLVSPLSLSAADMLIAQQALDLARQPVQPSTRESATELETATAPATPMDPLNPYGASVRIHAWECVSGTLTGQPMSYYLGKDQCEGQKPDVVFVVTDDDATLQTTSEQGGRQVDDLDGPILIEETLPAGYETPAIFCSSLGGQPGEVITGSGTAVNLPPGADDDYQCSFYNIPSDLSATGTGDVLVYTYACASAPPPNSTYAWYFQNCAARQNGATFVLDTPDVDIETNAGDSINGAVTMRGLKVGNYSLTETEMVPNHESGAVFCAEIGKADLPGPAQMMPQPLSGNTIAAPVTADKLLYCQWYHVPTTSAYTPIRQTA